MESQLIKNNPQISIIIPTYNESLNILNILGSIKNILPKNILVEALVVDDNSPDGTGQIVEKYIKDTPKTNFSIGVLHRTAKIGLGSAIMSGIKHAKGNMLVIMDGDLSHPPEIIPKMIDALKNFDLVIASRYIKGGKVIDWPMKRRLISKLGTKIANISLGIQTKDPMSGFFAFKKPIINGLKIDAIGYKLLLEILVKLKDVRIQEIPYTFQNRTDGSSKMDASTVIDYMYSIWRLYLHNRSITDEPRKSIHFVSKVGRFFTVGASGLLLNLVISTLFVSGITEFWYIHANLVGIFFSMTTNFFLNKVWTFRDRDFSSRLVLSQYLKFLSLSSVGALVQISLVYYLVDVVDFTYSYALILAVLTAAMSNFILNKKLTFNEKIWS